MLRPRSRTSSKGDHGKGLLMAGSDGLTGAALMSAAACLRAGIGTLRVLCPQCVRPALYRLPESMAVGFPGGWENGLSAFARMLPGVDCVGAGPGMGKGGGVEAAVRAALASGLPCVLDADGLNALARLPDKSLLHEGVILTPHPGEMARLCEIGIPEVLRAPEELALRRAREWGCTVLLKGADTAVAAPDGRLYVNHTGNPGLAKGGSGDVLTGITLAMLGQKLPPFEAGCVSAYLLGASADKAVAMLAERTLLARDVCAMIQNTIEEDFI